MIVLQIEVPVQKLEHAQRFLEPNGHAVLSLTDFAQQRSVPLQHWL